MSQSPLDMLKARMAGVVLNAASDVATSAINEGTELVKNGIKTKLNGMAAGRTVTVNPEPEVEDDDEYDDDEDSEESDDESEDNDNDNDEDDEDDEDTDDNDDETEEDSPIPMAFDAFDRKKNLECAAAVWKIWGLRDTDCANDVNLEPDIIAQFKNGIAFVGNMTDLTGFCEENDLGSEDVDVHGINKHNEYDSSEIDSIKVNKDTIQYITAFLTTIDISGSEEMFRDFHWDADATVTKIVRNIPFMDGIPLTMCGVAQAIIYTAKKDGKVETYIHEFGEDSGEKPKMYALPTAEGDKWPKSILINGGNMRVEGRGIVD